MHKFFYTFVLFVAVWLSAADDIYPVAGNISVGIPSTAGHSVPIVEFLRRLERVIRQQAKFDNTSGSQELIVALSDEAVPGREQYKYDPRYRRTVLKISSRWQEWNKHPQLGRTLVSAILQSRMGNDINKPLPACTYWLADALWAEFVHREKTPHHLLRFTYLEGLRNSVIAGGKVVLTEPNLQPPPFSYFRRPVGRVYLERARLMLEIVQKMNRTSKHNLLKDYCFISADGAIPGEESFINVFGSSLQKLVRMPGEKLADANEKKRFYQALDLAAMRTLFTIYAPLPAAEVAARIKKIDQVNYRRSAESFTSTAALSDLPRLLALYKNCANLPREKMLEINELILMSPAELRPQLLKLNTALNEITRRSESSASDEIKSAMLDLQIQLQRCMQIEALLDQYEKLTRPPLNEWQILLNAPERESVLTPRIEEIFMLTR